MPTYNNKARVISQTTEEKILTPNLFDILVGENEDEVLIYQAMQDDWNKKTKITSSWSNEQKQLFYTYLILQSGDYFGLQDGRILHTISSVIGEWSNKQKV